MRGWYLENGALYPNIRSVECARACQNWMDEAEGKEIYTQAQTLLLMPTMGPRSSNVQSGRADMYEL